MKKLMLLVVTIVGLCSSLYLSNAAELKREFFVDSFYSFESADDKMDNFTEYVGVGVGYYVNKNLGFRARTLGPDLSGLLVEIIESSVLYRAQLAKTPFIVYAELGSRYSLEEEKWYALAGPGISMKLGKYFEPFVEARHINNFNDTSYFSYGAGVRINF